MSNNTADNHEYEGSLIARRYTEGIFSCDETEEVLKLLNKFLDEFSASPSAEHILLRLCPVHIHSLASLENWLIQVRIEAQRQEGQHFSQKGELFQLKGILEAASRHMQKLMRG